VYVKIIASQKWDVFETQRSYGESDGVLVPSDDFTPAFNEQ